MKSPRPFRLAIVLAVSTAFPLVAVVPAADTGGSAKDKDPVKHPVRPMLAHTVFFQLADRTDEEGEKLVAACKKYLSGHPGTVHFSAGVRAREMQRDVNDQEFDVALHIVFKNEAAHDAYQKDARHLKFIETCKDSWKSVRVFDSLVVPVVQQKVQVQKVQVQKVQVKKVQAEKVQAEKVQVKKVQIKGKGKQEKPVKAKSGDASGPERIPLPDRAAGFCGMIRAKVASKTKALLVVEVEQVLKEWKHNRAKDSGALVGKRVVVGCPKEGGEYVTTLARFVGTVKVGEVLELDVAHKGGETLTLLELTGEQRERIGRTK